MSAQIALISYIHSGLDFKGEFCSPHALPILVATWRLAPLD